MYMNTFATATNFAGRQVWIEQRLGAGGFGVVYLVRDANGRLYALKDIVCQNNADINGAEQEIEVLRLLDYPNIVKLMAADRSIDMRGIPHVGIMMEYCSGGDLNDRLARPSNCTTELKWMCQIAGALAYLHSRNVVHRDLKPQNVLLTDSANENVKLADFGLARTFISLQAPRLSHAQYYMQTNAGTQNWMAPEVFSGHYTEKADVFSMGILFYAIVERSSIRSFTDGKIYFGAFVPTPYDMPMVGLGYAMHMANGDPVNHLPFTRAPPKIQRLVYNLTRYDFHHRMNASDVRETMLVTVCDKCTLRCRTGRITSK